jgi:hypothetical protein
MLVRADSPRWQGSLKPSCFRPEPYSLAMVSATIDDRGCVGSVVFHLISSRRREHGGCLDRRQVFARRIVTPGGRQKSTLTEVVAHGYRKEGRQAGRTRGTACRTRAARNRQPPAGPPVCAPRRSGAVARRSRCPLGRCRRLAEGNYSKCAVFVGGSAIICRSVSCGRGARCGGL